MTKACPWRSPRPFYQGDTNISSIDNWKDVIIDEDTKLQISPTGKFYIQNLICEFEYLYQMALSSLLPQNYVKELSKCWSTEKELSLSLLFL